MILSKQRVGRNYNRNWKLKNAKQEPVIWCTMIAIPNDVQMNMDVNGFVV